MLKFKVESLSDVYYALEQCRVFNENAEALDLNESDMEHCNDKIQDVIGDIEEFLCGTQLINNESITNSVILSMYMWDYITDKIDDTELLKYLKDKKLIVEVN